MKKLKQIISLLVFAVVCQACVEELDIENVTSEENAGTLVVEATITDMLERQRVYLSRSVARLDVETDTTYFRFRALGLGLQDSVEYEENATVRILGSDGSSFSFIEEEQGTYLSQEAFAAQTGVNYRLEVVTSSGIAYESDEVGVPDASQIINVYAERFTTDLGVEGVQIYVDSEPVSGNPSNFRYTYEETYKIIAPNWNKDDFLLTNYDPCALPVPTYDLEVVPRETQNQICYSTVPSNTIIQGNSINSSNSVNAFPIRFLSKDNYVMAHRYSILVRQHVQSAESFGFYETLKELSESDNVFSQVQPGPLEANIKRVDGSTNEMVLGYIDVTSVSEQRIYLEFEDFFPGEELPPYPFPCFEESAPESHVSYCFRGLVANLCPPSTIERIDDGIINYTGLNNENIGACPGPYTFIARVCGDCTLLGQNVAPDFWIE
jgi:hypothetical protein